MRRLVLALLCFPVLGCQVVLDIEEFPSGFGGGAASATAAQSSSVDTASATSGSTSTGGPACGLDLLGKCVQKVAVFEEGWTQMGAFVEGASGDCTSLPAGVVEVAGSFTPSPCACEEPPTKPFCSTIAVSSDNTGCSSVAHANSAGCNFLSGGGINVLASMPISANCSGPSGAPPPPPAIVDPKVLCVPMADPACAADEVCASEGANLCIAHDGVVACPMGFQLAQGSPFEKLLGFDCSTCVHPASECPGTTIVFDDDACTTMGTVVANDGLCKTLSFTAESYQYVTNSDEVASCEPIPEKVTTSQQTICCL